MKDKLSALLDDDLDDDACAPVLDKYRKAPELQTSWEYYCLIGDTLRGDVGGSPGFASRVMDAISAEPTVLAPTAPKRRRGFGQSLMPVAASVMGVAAVGLVAYTFYSGADDIPITAGTTLASQSSAAGATTVMQSLAPASGDLDDPHRKYVFVHQAMSGGGPLPGGVQYVRSVSDVRGDFRR